MQHSVNKIISRRLRKEKATPKYGPFKTRYAQRLLHFQIGPSTLGIYRSPVVTWVSGALCEDQNFKASEIKPQSLKA